MNKWFERVILEKDEVVAKEDEEEDDCATTLIGVLFLKDLDTNESKIISLSSSWMVSSILQLFEARRFITLANCDGATSNAILVIREVVMFWVVVVVMVFTDYVGRLMIRL